MLAGANGLQRGAVKGRAMKPRRLGRGLDFLLSAPKEAVEETRNEEIEVSKIDSNPWQPRTKFDEAQIESLTESIRRHGVVQPIVVRGFGDRFQLVAGE